MLFRKAREGHRPTDRPAIVLKAFVMLMNYQQQGTLTRCPLHKHIQRNIKRSESAVEGNRMQFTVIFNAK